MCIEPCAEYDESTGKYVKYLMYDSWGSKYEPYFNIYGETEVWMCQKR